LARAENGSAPAGAERLPLEPFVVPVSTGAEVHRLIDAGHPRAEVARALGLSKSTVSYHARRLGMDIDARAARR
jgi:hypothetical protein